MLRNSITGALYALILTLTTFTTIITRAADSRGDMVQLTHVDEVQLESDSPKLQTTLLDEEDFRQVLAQLEGTRFESLLDLSGDQVAFIESVYALDEAGYEAFADLVNPEDDDEVVGKMGTCKSRIGCWFLINFRCKGQFDGYGDGKHKGPIRGSCEV